MIPACGPKTMLSNSFLLCSLKGWISEEFHLRRVGSQKGWISEGLDPKGMNLRRAGAQKGWISEVLDPRRVESQKLILPRMSFGALPERHTTSNQVSKT